MTSSSGRGTARPSRGTRARGALRNGFAGEALRRFYGDRAAARFNELVTDQLTIAVEILNAAKVGDEEVFNEANERWYENGEDIAALMARLDSRNWPRDEAEDMWEEHLDATLREAVAVLQDDCTADVDTYDEVHDMALEMADFFGSGVIKRFQDGFRATITESRNTPERLRAGISREGACGATSAPQARAHLPA